MANMVSRKYLVEYGLVGPLTTVSRYMDEQFVKILEKSRGWPDGEDKGQALFEEAKVKNYCALNIDMHDLRIFVKTFPNSVSSRLKAHLRLSGNEKRESLADRDFGKKAFHYEHDDSEERDES